MSRSFFNDTCGWHPWSIFSVEHELEWGFVIAKVAKDANIIIPCGYDPLNDKDLSMMVKGLFDYSASQPSYYEESEWPGAIAYYLLPSHCLNVKAFPPVIRKLVKQGIPSSLREHAWLIISGGINFLRTRQIDYLALAYRAETSPHRNLIELDITRTFQDERLWLAKKGYIVATRLLCAYSLRNPALGYCQGLSYVSACLSQVMSEECAFATLCTLLEDGLIPPDYYTSLQGAVVDQQVLESLVGLLLKPLCSYLGEGLSEFTVSAIPWYMCLFSATFPMNVTIRIWDFLFVHGSVVIFRVALSILEKVQTIVVAKGGDARTHLAAVLKEVTVETVPDFCLAWGDKVTNESIIELREMHRKEEAQGLSIPAASIASALEEEYFLTSQPAPVQRQPRISRRKQILREVAAFLGK